MLSQFSNDNKYFAQLSAEGKLKIWDTSTSTLEQEFTPDFHLTSPCTCLQFVQFGNEANNKESPNKKKRRSSLGIIAPYIALGTTSGSLLIYSITKADLDCTIESGLKRGVSCLSWQKGFNVYAALEQTIVCWDVREKNITSQWKSGVEKITAILKVPTYKQLITASRNIKIWNIATKKLLRTFTGHSSEVTLLKFIRPTETSSYFISGSKNDRILSCWNVNEKKETNAICNFQLEDIPLSVSIGCDADGSTKLSAVTRSGVCHVYQETLNGKATKPFKPKTTIQIAADTTNSQIVTPIPLLAATITDDLMIKIGYGTEQQMTFENVVLSGYEKVQSLIRKDPTKFVKRDSSSDNSKRKVPIIDIQSVHYLTSASSTLEQGVKRKTTVDDNKGVIDVPMQKRLENLTLSNEQTADGTGIKLPKGDNIAQLLLQGFQSQDKEMLRNILMVQRDENIIRNTLKRLPIHVVILLLNELSGYVKGKTLDCQISSIWLKNLLQIHAGILVSNPQLSEHLGPILSSIESRLNLQQSLNRLKGRLDLLVSQVDATNKVNEDSEVQDALLVYNDKMLSDSDSDIIDVNSDVENDEEWMEDEIEENGEDHSDDEEGEEDDDDDDDDIMSM